MIEITNVTKTYTMGDNVVHALRGVSLRIEEGDFVAIMGPSGSGKSTLAQILGLLDVPSSGSYRLAGREVSQLSEDELAILRRQEIGFVFQQFNLLPRMDATENVGLPLLYSKFASLDRARKLLDLVGLGPRSHHRPNELSGGQQQRVAIARALVNEPRIIFADEPTGNLDSVSEGEILKQLRVLNEQGITVLIVTHEEEIGAQANRLIRLRDGVILSDERRVPLRPAPPRAAPALTTKPGHWFTDIFEHFRQGLRTLAANKIRTGLSMLGILIGVAAVVAMLALGRGAQKAIEEQLSSLGSNLLVLRPGAMRIGGVAQDVGATTRLTVDDADLIAQKIEKVKAVGPTVNGKGQITYANKNWSTTVQGVAPVYATMHASVPDNGRFFTEDENRQRARVAVIGATLVRELFGGANPIGEYIKINKVNFLVIGVLPEKGANGFRDQDDIIMVPVLTAMHRLMGKEYVDNIDIEIRSAGEVDAAEDEILNLMYARKRVPTSMQDEAFQIRNMADIQSALSQSSQTMSVLLASIAAISLVVGGIGIMNIMLVSVTERTKEIGLRKAVGARRHDILMQFLAESVVVSVIGGLIGIVIGWTVTIILSTVAGWATSVSPESVALAFFCSAFIGIVFGIYPAQKASELHPIVALRYE
jgi:macrolide transport system ATP-binding/permease protein